jgi:preprotein translocase SecE subunit
MADDDRDRSGNSPAPKDRKSLEDNTAQPLEYQGRGPTGQPSGLLGFLHVYKPGQGYWTRMGTIASVLLVMILLGRLVYATLDDNLGPPNGPLSTLWIAGIVAVLGVVVGLLLWRYLNKPNVVDFMIATESEMKKVNWTSKKDLIGSTKVVIIFMFLIAAVLFLIDIFFGYFFFFIKVLQYPPM